MTETLTAPVRIGASLHEEVLEQVMRICDDDALLEAFAACQESSPQAAGALGHLIASNPAMTVTAGTPLAAWVTGGAWDIGWRRTCAPASQSLFVEYELLCDLYGTPASGAYAGLQELRDHSIDAPFATPDRGAARLCA